MRSACLDEYKGNSIAGNGGKDNAFGEVTSGDHPVRSVQGDGAMTVSSVRITYLASEQLTRICSMAAFVRAIDADTSGELAELRCRRLRRLCDSFLDDVLFWRASKGGRHELHAVEQNILTMVTDLRAAASRLIAKLRDITVRCPADFSSEPIAVCIERLQSLIHSADGTIPHPCFRGYVPTAFGPAISPALLCDCADPVAVAFEECYSTLSLFGDGVALCVNDIREAMARFSEYLGAGRAVYFRSSNRGLSRLDGTEQADLKAYREYAENTRIINDVLKMRLVHGMEQRDFPADYERWTDIAPLRLTVDAPRSLGELLQRMHACQREALSYRKQSRRPVPPSFRPREQHAETPGPASVARRKHVKSGFFRMRMYGPPPYQGVSSTFAQDLNKIIASLIWSIEHADSWQKNPSEADWAGCLLRSLFDVRHKIDDVIANIARSMGGRTDEHEAQMVRWLDTTSAHVNLAYSCVREWQCMRLPEQMDRACACAFSLKETLLALESLLQQVVGRGSNVCFHGYVEEDAWNLGAIISSKCDLPVETTFQMACDAFAQHRATQTDEYEACARIGRAANFHLFAAMNYHAAGNWAEFPPPILPEIALDRKTPDATDVPCRMARILYAVELLETATERARDIRDGIAEHPASSKAKIDELVEMAYGHLIRAGQLALYFPKAGRVWQS